MGEYKEGGGLKGFLSQFIVWAGVLIVFVVGCLLLLPLEAAVIDFLLNFEWARNFKARMAEGATTGHVVIIIALIVLSGMQGK